MLPEIDCFFIGYNEMVFAEYEQTLRNMSAESNAYKDLRLNFVKHNNQVFTANDMLNELRFSNEHDGRGKVSLTNVFNLTIAYLGSFLDKRGLSFDYINSFQYEKDTLVHKLLQQNIRAIVIPTTLYVSPIPIIEMVRLIKETNDKIPVIVGGPFVATQMKSQDQESIQMLLKSINADYYVHNAQGETALVELLHAMKNNQNISGMNNVIYKNNKTYIFNDFIPENNSLDVNMPDWSLFSGRLGESVAMRSSISCAFSCSFCGFPEHAGKYQTASLNAVENQLNQLQQLGSVKRINMIDDTINVPPARFKEMLRMMIRNEYNFLWNCNLRCQFVDEEMVMLMKESGCEGVFLGIESANQTILNNMNKLVTIDKYKKGIELLKKYDITTHASFVIGFPGETEETVMDTIQFIEEYQPDFFRAQLWYCDPFTPIWNEKDKYDIRNSQFEWKHATMDASTASNLIKSMFINIKNSIWMPQYNFDFVSVFSLQNRGLELEQIKDFIKAFNQSIKNQLQNPQSEDISPNLLRTMKKACLDQKKSFSSRYDVEFDFEKEKGHV
ncbi:PhpK family radical SAM P-methyltransferase [Paenibacillus tengchongensis]|uniref:PhpK family radical SAM P-methyltransferase n=1 Tax=Paenibacillus tengchongensis TaxID=2608684 RepID=UPI00124D0999|nr:PhpK family radical SAM P-methyltransferase [Paenibacillus tengchongensis]